MDLLLWRHAEAEDISPSGGDLARRLTARGEQQAAAMAAWLKMHGPKEPRILVSPAVRTQQTAQALGVVFETVPAIAPDAAASDLLAAAGWPDSGQTGRQSVILVGHQPTLGEVAHRLLTGREGYLSVKKGAIWWFVCRQRGGETQTVLRAVLTAEMT